ncbi:MAG: ThiF family adenylyltransferase [Methylobacteriaceae bacterium]|nr:ThiF family adenylyltransferase [Methylobacteriaceae bacterium]
MNISGHTALIPHIGYPTGSFKAPMIYNPWFEAHGVDAVVVPMGVPAEAGAIALPVIFAFTNFHGALITMPHKVSVVSMLDEVSKAVQVAGACNAVRRMPDGRLVGDQFDGAGFVRGVLRKGQRVEGARALVCGTGGVGSAIAASLAGAGVGALALYDVDSVSMDRLARRLADVYPRIAVTTGSNDPQGFDIVVNATPLGMKPGDPLPLDVTRLAPETFVGEVVMKQETTPFLAAARARGCRTQIGVDMLFEMIPAYLDFFGFGEATAEELRALARVSY